MPGTANAEGLSPELAAAAGAEDELTIARPFDTDSTDPEVLEKLEALAAQYKELGRINDKCGLLQGPLALIMCRMGHQLDQHP